MGDILLAFLLLIILVLDEAQDFPVELLRILKKVSKSVTVFGDTQQALDNVKANTADITNAFDAGRRVYYLNQNYRNTKEISDVAHLFYTGDPGDIPARPKRFGNKPRGATKVNNRGGDIR